MQKKILVMILILTMIIPVIDLEPVYAFSQQWEIVADISAMTDGIAITAMGPTSTLSVDPKGSNGFLTATKGTFLINAVRLAWGGKDKDRLNGCENTGVLATGVYDPLNYQYAVFCYDASGYWANANKRVGPVIITSPNDPNLIASYGGGYGIPEDRLMTQNVELLRSYSVGEYLLANNNAIWNNVSRSDLGFMAKFSSEKGTDHIKVLRRLWPRVPRLLVNTSPNQVVTSELVINGSMSDPNIADTITTNYSIDGGAQTSVKTITTDRNTANQEFSFSNVVINTSVLAEGSHTLTVWAIDSTGLKSADIQIPFKVDRSNPVISSYSLSSSTNSLTAMVVASDSVAGLSPNPYRFEVDGFGATSWMASGFYTQANLTANKQYNINCEVTDAIGHISAISKSSYTKAQVPQLTTDQTSSTALRVAITDSNPDNTQYQLLVNDNTYITPEGVLTSTPVWSTLQKNGEGKAFMLKGLTPQTIYGIKVKARNDENIETAWSQTATAITLIAPPTPPSSITSTSTDTTITTKWDPAFGATGYELELDGKTIDMGQATQYSALKLNPGTPHTIKIRARNEGGLGEWSEIVTKSTLPAKPAVPANLSALPLSNMITLTWDNVPGATGYDVEVDDVVTSIGPNTSYKHTSLASGTLHKYRVRSINAGDKSDWSGYATATTTLDSGTVPAGLTATTTQSAITLSWEPASNATGYDIEVDGIALDNGNKTTYTHESPTVGVEHKYRVKSKKGSTHSDWSAMVTAIATADSFGVPVVTEKIQDTSITLNWKPVKDAISYDVEVDGILQNIGSDTAFVHGSIIPMKVHTYRVRAKSTVDDSPWSDLKTLTTAALPTPENVTTTSSALSIDMTWNPVLGAENYDVEFDGSLIPDLTGNHFSKEGLKAGTTHTTKVRAKSALGTSSWSPSLTVQTKGEGSSTQDISCLARKNAVNLFWPETLGAEGYDIEADGKVIGTVKTLSYQQNGLEAGSKHSYRMRVSGTENWSKVLQVTTLSEKPAVPTNFAASQTMTSIQLSWDKVPSAAEYDLEIDGVICDIGVNNSYLAAKLLAGSEHKFRVRAKNPNGFSDWSPLLTKSTLSSLKKFDLSTTAGDEFNLILSGASIQDLGGYTFTVNYNPEELEVSDLCGFTSRADLGTGSITGTDVNVVQFVPGTIVFKKGGSAELNELWSSAVNSIKFAAKKAGNTSISYTIN